MLRSDERVGGRSEVRFAVTGRSGGVSAAPYDTLNLGGHVGDDPQAVEENRRRVAGAVGLPGERVLYMRQVHGADVAVVDGPRVPGHQPPEVDALVTREPGLALAVLVADCTPVLLGDPHAGVVGVAHAGRAGLAAGVVAAVLTAMRNLGAADIVARVGPSICGRCYEVPPEMADDVAAVVPAARAVSARGTAALDVAAGVVAQLSPHCASVERRPGCSREDPDLFSYREAPTTGRFAGLAWLSP